RERERIACRPHHHGRKEHSENYLLVRPVQFLLRRRLVAHLRRVADYSDYRRAVREILAERVASGKRLRRETLIDDAHWRGFARVRVREEAARHQWNAHHPEILRTDGARQYPDRIASRRFEQQRGVDS